MLLPTCRRSIPLDPQMGHIELAHNGSNVAAQCARDPLPALEFDFFHVLSLSYVLL